MITVNDTDHDNISRTDVTNMSLEELMDKCSLL